MADDAVTRPDDKRPDSVCVGGLLEEKRSASRADDAASSLRAVRGIRGLVIGVAAWALAAGLLLEQTWLLVFGAVFLAEELYETGVLVLVLRMADDATSGAR